VIGRFYIGKHYCSSQALGNKKENLAVFNLADFHDSPNRQNKFYTKFSSYMVYNYTLDSSIVLYIHSSLEDNNQIFQMHSIYL